MGKYYVHNIQEGSRPGNWLKYWEDAVGHDAGFCHRCDCLSGPLEIATDGAHVQLVSGNDKHWYIVPLCHKCNCQFGQNFWVEGPLVRAKDPNIILE